MKVFISWSGPLSEKLGEEMRNWLPIVLQSISPYFTPSDVEKGSRWLQEVTNELSESQVGILCVTPDNIHSDWLLFEAGALSKTMDQSRVCTILFGIKPTDLAGPLKQFQATPFTRDDIFKMVSTINSCLQEKELPVKNLEKVFSSYGQIWKRM